MHGCEGSENFYPQKIGTRGISMNKNLNNTQLPSAAPNINRKAFLAQPNEHLLLQTNPFDAVRRFDDFLDASGLDERNVLMPLLCTYPLPIYRKDPNQRLARWTQVNPMFLWHPLMWLPENLALRKQYRMIASSGDPEQVYIESNSTWAIRIVIEMVRSGLYNPDDGTWLDVLAFYGLDVASEQERIALWLKGNRDTLLDAIDLTDLMPGSDDPDWGLRTAHELAEVLCPAQWELLALSIQERFAEQTQFNENDENVKRSLIGFLGSIAADAFAEIPVDPETGQDCVSEFLGLLEHVQEPGADVVALEYIFLGLLKTIAQDYRGASNVLDV